MNAPSADIESPSRAQHYLTVSLAAMVLLTCILFFLGTSGQIVFFPCYVAGLAYLGLLAFPGPRKTLLTRTGGGILAFTIYLSLTPLWGSLSVQPAALYFGYALLLFAFVFGIRWCWQALPAFANNLLAMMVTAAAVSAAYSVAMYHTVGFSPLDEQDRLYAIGRLGSPVISAMSYSVPALLAITMAVSRSRWSSRLGWSLVALLLLYTLVLTGTRSVWVGMAAALMVGVATYPGVTTKQRVVGVAAVIGIALLAVVAALSSDYREELLRRSTSFRPEIWTGVWEMIRSGNWLLGAGINADSSTHLGELEFVHPHSIYLATWFYGGLVGLLLLVGLIGYTFWSLLRCRSELRLAAITTLTFGVVALTMDGDRVLEKIDFVWIVFWLPMGISLVALDDHNVVSTGGSAT